MYGRPRPKAEFYEDDDNDDYNRRGSRAARRLKNAPSPSPRSTLQDPNSRTGRTADNSMSSIHEDDSGPQRRRLKAEVLDEVDSIHAPAVSRDGGARRRIQAETLDSEVTSIHSGGTTDEYASRPRRRIQAESLDIDVTGIHGGSSDGYADRPRRRIKAETLDSDVTGIHGGASDEYADRPRRRIKAETLDSDVTGIRGGADEYTSQPRRRIQAETLDSDVTGIHGGPSDGYADRPRRRIKAETLDSNVTGIHGGASDEHAGRRRIQAETLDGEVTSIHSGGATDEYSNRPRRRVQADALDSLVASIHGGASDEYATSPRQRRIRAQTLGPETTSIHRDDNHDENALERSPIRKSNRLRANRFRNETSSSSFDGDTPKAKGATKTTKKATNLESPRQNIEILAVRSKLYDVLNDLDSLPDSTRAMRFKSVRTKVLQALDEMGGLLTMEEEEGMFDNQVEIVRSKLTYALGKIDLFQEGK